MSKIRLAMISCGGNSSGHARRMKRNSDVQIVAGCDVNVEMISFGPSRAALYFLTKLKDLSASLNAIHSTFFSAPRCTPDMETF